MRASLCALLALSLVACSSSAKPSARSGSGSATRVEPGDPASPAAAKLGVGNLVVPTANAVTRTTFEHFVVASYVHDLIGPGAPCLRELEAAVVATYQVQTPEPSSYFVLEGNLPQAAVEKCIPEAFKGKVDVHVKKDGELAVFELGDLGQVFAAWRDRYVVVGERAHVAAALASSTDASNPWPARVAAAGTAPIWAYRTDRLMESLFAAVSKSYLVQLDRLATKPQPQFTGRLIIWYGNASDAAVVHRRARAGELTVQGTQGLVDTFRSMKITHDGTTVTMTFDQTTFALVDLDELLALASRWAAGQN